MQPEAFNEYKDALRNYIILIAGIVLIFMHRQEGMYLVALAVPSSGPSKQAKATP